MIKSIINSLDQPKSDSEAAIHFFYSVIHNFVNSIFAESPKIFEEIHRLIASSIDCDRLDYVTRDMQNSGLNSGSIEYDRLIASMKLVKNGEDFLFCPNIKSLPTIEDFFNRRWHLYQNIIFHHRVIKTDSLLENAIVNLAMDYFETPEIEGNLPHDKNVLPLDLSGLWKAVKEAVFLYFNILVH